MPRFLAVLGLALVLVTTAGCGMVRGFTLKPYRLDVQQGNFLDEEDLEQIQPGMTRTQVRFLLGTPMVADTFNDDRWDYVYYYRRGRSGDIYLRHFTVYFEGDQAIRVVRDPANTEVAPVEMGDAGDAVPEGDGETGADAPLASLPEPDRS